MGVAVIDRITRGTSGSGPFPVAWQDDLKLGFLSVANIAARDAIEEWKRVPYMTVLVESTQTEYTLGADTTIGGQVWTVKDFGVPADVLVESDILDVGGYIKSELIQNLTLSASYVVASEAAQLALTTFRGNFIIRTDTGDVYVKLNDNPAPTAIGDFALITYPGAVTSVNGFTGNVVITVTNLLAQGTNLADFNQAVDDSTAVNNLQITVGTHTTDIANNAADIATNAADIAALDLRVTQNEADILALQLGGGGGGGYVQVSQDSITNLPAQDTLNIYNGLTAVDNPGNTNTDLGWGGNLAGNTLIDGLTSYNVNFSNLTDFILDLETGGEFTITGGRLVTAPSTTAYSGLNIGVGNAPTAPDDGDIWLDGTSVYARVAGVTIDMGAVTPVSAYWATEGTTTIPATGGATIHTEDTVIFEADFDGFTTFGNYQFRFGGEGSQIGAWNGASYDVTLSFGSGIIITDNRGGVAVRGLQYNADYSAGFDSRSLIDRGYADGAYWKTTGTSTLTGTVTIATGGGGDILFTDVGATRGFLVGDGFDNFNLIELNADSTINIYAGGVLSIGGSGGQVDFSITGIRAQGSSAAARLETVSSTATRAGLRIPYGVTPTTPANGDIWTETTGDNRLYFRENGVTTSFVKTAGFSRVNTAEIFVDTTFSISAGAGGGTFTTQDNSGDVIYQFTAIDDIFTHGTSVAIGGAVGIELNTTLLGEGAILTLSYGADHVFTDTRTTPRGLIYGGNYSADFTDRSLADWGNVWKGFGTTTLSAAATINVAGFGVTFLASGAPPNAGGLKIDDAEKSMFVGVGATDYATATGGFSISASAFSVKATGGGIKYNADYSGSYTARSLVDKAYVDAAVGSGGWATDASTTTFTGSPTIDLDGNDLTFTVSAASSFAITRSATNSIYSISNFETGFTRYASLILDTTSNQGVTMQTTEFMLLAATKGIQVQAGKTIFANATATNASISIGSGTGDPSSANNGDLYYNSTANELRARINGAWVALGAGGGGWELTGTTNLTGAVTINGNFPNSFTWAATWTATGNNQAKILDTGTITSRSNQFDVMYHTNFTPTMVAGGQDQTLGFVAWSPTYNLNSQTGTVLTGWDYNPTISNGTPSSHTALKLRLGNVAIGNATATARLDIRGEGAIDLFRLENSAASEVLNIDDNGRWVHTTNTSAGASSFTNNNSINNNQIIDFVGASGYGHIRLGGGASGGSAILAEINNGASYSSTFTMSAGRTDYFRGLEVKITGDTESTTQPRFTLGAHPDYGVGASYDYGLYKEFSTTKEPVWMVSASNKNFSIGRRAGTAKLHVKSDINDILKLDDASDNQVLLVSKANTDYVTVNGTDTNFTINFDGLTQLRADKKTGSTADNDIFQITAGGGITGDVHGMRLLLVSGSGIATDGNAGDLELVLGTGAGAGLNGDLIIRSAATERMRVTSDGRIYGTSIHNNAGAITGTTNQYIASGTYTPTGTAITNVDSITELSLHYYRIGNVVTVAGAITIDPTAAAAATSIRFNLPIASNVSHSSKVAGTSMIINATTVSPGVMYGDAANDEVILQYVSIGSTAETMWFTFTYLIE